MRKQVKMIIAIILLVSVLASCTSDLSKVRISSQEHSTVISMSWWGNDPRHEYTLEGLSLFQEKNPDIVVNHSYGVWNGYERRYLMQMASHNNCDVMQINYAWLSEYSEDGTGYYDINKLADQIDLSSFTEEDLATGTRNGHLNALPIAYNTVCLFYNADMFAKYGLDIPSTWDDLFDAAKAMRKDNIYVLGMVNKHLFLLLNAWFEQTTDRTLFDDNGKYIGSASDVKMILEFYKELSDNKVIMPLYDFNVSNLEDGAVAGTVCWTSDSIRYCQPAIDEGTDIVIGDYLRVSEGDQSEWYIKPATMYAISINCSDPESCGRLVDFLLNDPDFAVLQGTEKGVPVSSSARQALLENGMLSGIEYQAGEFINDNLPHMNLINPMLENADFQDTFKSVSDKYIYNEATLEESASELHRELMKLAG
ncbi:oligogalacturonide transport system substrate-binding protein [Ruminococcaceae bacterium YRB3002]|nr:oligogalacturonide transport system substrate-binding protein [Ruminococcaceae bacterium YRB3002]